MSEQIFEKLKELLSTQNANFRAVSHESVKTSAEVAVARGTQLGQGAKALVCAIKGGGAKRYVLAVLPADYKADLQLIARALDGTRASLASPDEVARLTDCVPGSVPPFSFCEELELIADPSLFTRYDELAFNAGLLDRSIILNAKDYERIARPRSVKFAARQ